jgi:hypothetical protein
LNVRKDGRAINGAEPAYFLIPFPIRLLTLRVCAYLVEELGVELISGYLPLQQAGEISILEPERLHALPGKPFGMQPPSLGHHPRV